MIKYSFFYVIKLQIDKVPEYVYSINTTILATLKKSYRFKWYINHFNL